MVLLAQIRYIRDLGRTSAPAGLARPRPRPGLSDIANPCVLLDNRASAVACGGVVASSLRLAGGLSRIGLAETQPPSPANQAPSRSNVERLMTLSTSTVAACCSSASSRSRVSSRHLFLCRQRGNCDGVRPLAHCGASTSYGVAFLPLCRLLCRAVSLPPPRLRTTHRSSLR